MTMRRNSADMPGMDTTIFEVVRSYRQSLEAPASAIDPDMRVTLPVPYWAEAGYTDNGTANFTAGQLVTLALLQVPANERSMLYGVQATRVTGDNTIERIRMVQPSGYQTGSGVVELIFLSTPATEIWWPDPGGQQTLDRGLPVGPLLVEPLGVVEITSSGAGVAASTFDYQIVRRRIKMTRASAPG